MEFRRSKINQAVVTAIAAMSASHAAAQEAREIEEVVVTATKRAVPLQDVPIAVQALTEDAIADLGITNFEDYLIQLPGVTAGVTSGGWQDGVWVGSWTACI